MILMSCISTFYYIRIVQALFFNVNEKPNFFYIPNYTITTIIVLITFINVFLCCNPWLLMDLLYSDSLIFLTGHINKLNFYNEQFIQNTISNLNLDYSYIFTKLTLDCLNFKQFYYNLDYDKIMDIYIKHVYMDTRMNFHKILDYYIEYVYNTTIDLNKICFKNDFMEGNPSASIIKTIIKTILMKNIKKNDLSILNIHNENENFYINIKYLDLLNMIYE